MSTSKYVVKSFTWGAIAKILDAGIKFISVPLLLNYFGKDYFGLIALAISINAYMRLFDLGINTGSIKYFSEWIGDKKLILLDRVARTSIVFYGVIGILNAVFLIIFAYFGMELFSLTSSQAEVMRNLFFILALVAVLNWSTSVFSQLLTANEDIVYEYKINIGKSLASLIIIYITIHFEWDLVSYFAWFSIVNTFVLVPFYFRAKKTGLISSFKPATDWKNFSQIFKYSVAILAIGVFSMTATSMRPIVLGIFSNNGVGIVTDYRIMETITVFIISIGGLFMSIFLPKAAKLVTQKENDKKNQFAYEGTLYTSIICIILCLPIILNAKEIINIYVGNNYIHLSNWLVLWVITILLYLHNSPVASLVLATGRTRILIISSAFSCIVSLIINAIFCKDLGAGSAVLGYSVYIAIQISFYYFYFNNKVLKLKSFKIFKSFIIPTILGFAALFLIIIFKIELANIYLQIIFKSTLWFITFSLLLAITKTLDIKKIIKTLKKSPQ